MSYQLILGFKEKDFHKLTNVLGWDASKEIRTNDEHIEEFTEQVAPKFTKTIEDIYKRMWKSAGFQYSPSKRTDYYNVQTPAGNREMSTGFLTLEYDENDLDPTPDTAVIGFTLSTRYVPCYLDYENKHGGFTTFALDQQMISLIQIAYQEIIKDFPIFKEADLIVRIEDY